MISTLMLITSGLILFLAAISFIMAEIGRAHV